MGNVKSGALAGGLEELPLRAIPTIEPTAIIKIATINQVFFDFLLAILVTSWHKPHEVLQVTGQHKNSYADEQYCGYYGSDESMAAKPSDIP